MRNVLDYLAILVRMYGKWPSFAYLCLATACPVLAVTLALLLR